jgi:hypothetical protein
MSSEALHKVLDREFDTRGFSMSAQSSGKRIKNRPAKKSWAKTLLRIMSHSGLANRSLITNLFAHHFFAI